MFHYFSGLIPIQS